MATNKLNLLLKQKERLFHTADLRLLWGIEKNNTLYTIIKRFNQKGILFPIQKGLYSTIPPNQLDPLILGRHLIHRYTYLSTETVLSKAGIILQTVFKITFISDFSRIFIVGENHYLVRRLQSKFLHNTTGVSQNEDGLLLASPERAIADLLYFQPNYHFDAVNFINWPAVKEIQKKVGFK